MGEKIFICAEGHTYKDVLVRVDPEPDVLAAIEQGVGYEGWPVHIRQSIERLMARAVVAEKVPERWREIAKFSASLRDGAAWFETSVLR
jgi:hypothetical protein